LLALISDDSTAKLLDKPHQIHIQRTSDPITLGVNNTKTKKLKRLKQTMQEEHCGFPWPLNNVRISKSKG
jgi:hypothetical protein